MVYSMYYSESPPMPLASHKPVFMSWTDLRNAVKSLPPQAIKKKGKIYVKGNFLFINEPNKGIHIFDNSDPKSPKSISFINIPGNVDLAAKGSVLYADSFTDLVSINISNPENISILARNNDVFPYNPFQTAAGDVHYYKYIDKSNGVVIDWERIGSDS